jgi:hypothetical protein
MATRKNADGSITVGILKEPKPVKESTAADTEPKPTKRAKAKNNGEG